MEINLVVNKIHTSALYSFIFIPIVGILSKTAKAMVFEARNEILMCIGQILKICLRVKTHLICRITGVISHPGIDIGMSF
jgi:hypothetical protein